MKKMLILLSLVLIVCLSGCSNNSNRDYDYDYDYEENQKILSQINEVQEKSDEISKLIEEYNK